MTSLAQYHATLAEWRRKYNVPLSQPSPNLAARRTSCVKKGCTAQGRQRHHKGNDLWFALLLPDAFAVRYLEFRAEDIANLCEVHHKSVHKVYKRLMRLVYAERDIMLSNDEPITKEWCDKWIMKFRTTFDRWRKLSVRRHKKRRKRRFPS